MEPTSIASKAFRLDSDLAPHTADVLAAEARGALREGGNTFRFAIEEGFLPTINWLERFRAVLEPIVREKHPVEISCSPAQVESLRRAGVHLIADIAVSAR